MQCGLQLLISGNLKRVHGILGSPVQVDQQLKKLVAVLPDLTVRLDRIKADLLMKLLTRQERVAANLLALRRALPEVNAASIVLRYPALLTDMTDDIIVEQIKHLRCDIGPVVLVGRLLFVCMLRAVMRKQAKLSLTTVRSAWQCVSTKCRVRRFKTSPRRECTNSSDLCKAH
jgi:hypothetical protein